MSTCKVSAYKEWFSWFLLTMFFFGHYFFRITPANMNIQIMKTFSLSVSDIGILIQCFFLPYTLAQLPVGYCIARFSTKRLITLACFMCAFATLLFSQASSFMILCGCTILYACFAAFGFVGAVSYANANLPKQYQSLAVGLTQSLGMVGGFLGVNLIAYFIQFYSWQHITLIMGLVLGLLAVLIAFLVPQTPAPIQQSKKNPETTEPADQERSIFLQSKTWFNALYAGFIYLPVMVFTESFGKNILLATQQHSEKAISFGLSLVFVGWIIGGPTCGIIADRYGRVLVMKISAVSGLIFTALFLFVPMSLLALNISLFLFGLTNTGIVGCYSISAEMHGPAKASVSIAVANMTTILVGALLVPLLPRLLEMQAHPVFVHNIPVYSAL
ncbi:MFS transporter, partial [bacterium]|nr:MFS transporter [bacterium]